MPDIRHTGIAADVRSGGGLFRGTTVLNTNTANTHVQGSPIDLVSRRDTMTYFTDFLSVSDASAWTATEIGTCDDAAVVNDGLNGIYRATHDTANEGFGSIQPIGAGNPAGYLVAAAGRVIVFEARVSITDVSNGDWYIGLGEPDSTFLSLAGALLDVGGDNHAGFHHLVADAGVPTLSAAGTALANVESIEYGAGVSRAGYTLPVPTLTDATYHKYGIRIEGTTSIEFYVDDYLVGIQELATAFDTEMCPTFANIANGTEQAMDIDYVLVTQTR